MGAHAKFAEVACSVQGHQSAQVRCHLAPRCAKTEPRASRPPPSTCASGSWPLRPPVTMTTLGEARMTLVEVSGVGTATLRRSRRPRPWRWKSARATLVSQARRNDMSAFMRLVCRRSSRRFGTRSSMTWGTRDGPSSLSRETRAPKGSVHPKHPRSHSGWRRPDPHATLPGRCTRPDDADLTPRAPPRRGAPECRCGKA